MQEPVERSILFDRDFGFSTLSIATSKARNTSQPPISQFVSRPTTPSTSLRNLRNLSNIMSEQELQAYRAEVEAVKEWWKVSLSSPVFPYPYHQPPLPILNQANFSIPIPNPHSPSFPFTLEPFICRSTPVSPASNETIPQKRSSISAAPYLSLIPRTRWPRRCGACWRVKRGGKVGGVV